MTFPFQGKNNLGYSKNNEIYAYANSNQTRLVYISRDIVFRKFLANIGKTKQLREISDLKKSNYYMYTVFA